MWAANLACNASYLDGSDEVPALARVSDKRQRRRPAAAVCRVAKRAPTVVGVVSYGGFLKNGQPAGVMV